MQLFLQTHVDHLLHAFEFAVGFEQVLEPAKISALNWLLRCDYAVAFFACLDAAGLLHASSASSVDSSLRDNRLASELTPLSCTFADFGVYLSDFAFYA